MRTLTSLVRRSSSRRWEEAPAAAADSVLHESEEEINKRPQKFRDGVMSRATDRKVGAPSVQMQVSPEAKRGQGELIKADAVERDTLTSHATSQADFVPRALHCTPCERRSARERRKQTTARTADSSGSCNCHLPQGIRFVSDLVPWQPRKGKGTHSS